MGLPLTEAEKIRIAEKLDDFTSRPNSFSLEIQVLKRSQSNHVPSDDFKYIIYYVITSDLSNASGQLERDPIRDLPQKPSPTC